MKYATTQLKPLWQPAPVPVVDPIADEPSPYLTRAPRPSPPKREPRKCPS